LKVDAKLMSAPTPSDSSSPSKLPPGNVYVIGDVHGEFEALVALVERLPLQADDLLIQLGDCVNRGPRSFDVVEYWLGFDRCRRYVLGGNHELMLYAFLCEGDTSVLGFDGEATLRAYERATGRRPVAGEPGSVPEEHLRFYAQAYPWTVSLLQTTEYVFTHAGYDLSRAAHAQSAEMLLWGSVVGQENRLSSQTVVRGHVPYPRVIFTSQGWIGVDTGCGLGGYLSCLRLPDRQVFTAHPASFRPRFWQR
jgi:serine/threonine protein phosphatase 1